MTFAVSPKSALHTQRQSRRDSTGSAATSALVSRTQSLPSHDRVASAAKYSIAIDFLSLPRPAENARDRKVREIICNKLQAWRENAISDAVEQTLETQGLDPEEEAGDTRSGITFLMQNEVDAQFSDLQTVIQRYKSAELKRTLSFVRAQAARDKAEPLPAPTPEIEPKAEERAVDAVRGSREMIEKIAQEHPETIKKLLELKRYDIVQMLVAKGIFDLRQTKLTDDGEQLSLLAYGVKHDLDDGFLRRLVEMGAPIPPYVDGVPLLKRVYERGQMKLFEDLIMHGAATNIQIDGMTLLGKLLVDGRTEFVLEGYYFGTPPRYYTWSSKFDPNATGANGQNVLHDLCERYSERIFMILVKLGANPHTKNNDQETPVQLLFKLSAEAGGLPRQEKRRIEKAVSNGVKKYQSRIGIKQ